MFTYLKKRKEKGVVLGTELRSCVEVEVTVLGSPSLMFLLVSVDVKQYRTELNC